MTDGAGRYAIIDLRPGTYVVTFTLPGFKTVRREGIVLEGAFAATVNADREVGALEETVTVSGASPVVDLQSTQNQFVLNRDVLDVLPAARYDAGRGSLVPGVSFYSQGFVEHDVRARLGDRRPAHLLRRHAHRSEPHAARAARPTARRERSRAGGAGLRRRIAVGGNAARRRADGLDSEGRRQPLLRRVARSSVERRAAERQRDATSCGRSSRQATSLDYSWDVNVVVGGPIRQNSLWFLLAQQLSQTNNLIPLPTHVLPGGRARRIGRPGGAAFDTLG